MGLAIRNVEGHEGFDDEKRDEWPFNEAPRALRVKAVAKIPELLEELIKDGTEMIAKVNEQVQTVDFLAEALNSIPEPGPVERRQREMKQEKLENGGKR
jgi:hypothetical protein